MEEEEYPNFGAAYPTTAQPAPEASSWNPALRPHIEHQSQDEHAPQQAAEGDDDFFARYPGATPKKQPYAEQPEPRDEEQEEEEDDEQPIPRRQSISVQHDVDVRQEAASPELLARVPESFAEAQGPVTSPVHDEEEEEAPQAPELGQEDDDEVFKPDESAQEQERELEGYAPVAQDLEATHESAEMEGGGVQQVDHAAIPSAKVEDGGETAEEKQYYEHQSSNAAAAFEQAQDESVEAPLMDDEQEPPTPGGAPAAVPEFDGEASPRRPPSKSVAAAPKIDRSFTTDFTPMPTAPPAAAEERPVVGSESWPEMGDDRTFGELLGDSEEVQEPAELEEDHVRPQAAAAPPAVQEEDLAAAWQAALDDDELLDESATKGDLDPSKFFGEDDDGFLALEEEAPAPQQRNATTNRTQYQPTQQQQPQQQQRNLYAAPGPQFTQSQSHGRAGGTPDTGLYDLYSAQDTVSQKPQRPAAPQQAQSFADRSKGGYQSPYDLPMDVVKPRRQAPSRQGQGPMQADGSRGQAPKPPPRTSSFTQQQQPPHRQMSVSSDISSPPQSSHGPTSQTPSAKSTPKTDSGFFADLPITAKPRKAPPVAAGAYLPQTPPITPSAGQMGMPGAHPSRAPAVQPVQSQQFGQQGQGQQAQPVPAPAQQSQSMYAGLRQPDRMPLLPNQPAPTQTQPPPPAQTRYSPAPPAAPATSSRYSPAPAAQPSQARTRFQPGPPAAAVQNPFAPRTSSPLAAQHQQQQEKPMPALPYETSRGMSMSPPTTMAGMVNGAAASRYSPAEPMSNMGAPPPPQTAPPMRRPRTQSPGETMKQPRLAMMSSQPERHMSAVHTPSQQQNQQRTLPPRPPGSLLPHRRQFSHSLTFAAPQDERAHDPLERWRGAPIFRWNAAGSIVSSFPKQTPFYTAGAAPSVKCTPGDIVVQDATALLPLAERTVKFPGPLTARSKGRKKDVLAWMAGKIEDLEREVEGMRLDFGVSGEERGRAEEKVVLWRVVKVFVEYDGVLEAGTDATKTKKIEEEVRAVLLPNLAQMAQVADLHPTPTSASFTPGGDTVDKNLLFQLRQALLEGDRTKAAWLAEEHKLWGHAMLIASTLGGGDIWKQIIGSFVRSQVKSAGSDARSLAALYQVFAGNAEDCVDELVPPSARAGYAMVSVGQGVAAGGNPLEGLDQWRETLGLVTSNRTLNDGQSIVALGKLLASYGRVEAAHSCWLFARNFVKHGGADDGEAQFVLLGASAEEGLGNDLDAIILTEIYEWAASLGLPSTAVPYVPHLQAFKLLHAQTLAAHGLKSKAQAYCEHITAAYTSTTRPSQYYHPTFTQAVADLSAYLAQTPQDGKGGFFSKPAMNKVSTGMGTWFTKFVSGEDDHDSNASGQGAKEGDMMAGPGPFANVNGDSADISRSGSGTELYNPMMGGMAIPNQPAAAPHASAFAPSSAPSRYNPMSHGAPRPLPTSAGSSPYMPQGAVPQGLGLPAPEQQRPASARAASTRYAPVQPTQHSSLGVPRPEASRSASDFGMPYATASRRGSAQDPGSQGSYEPSPSLAQEASPYAYQPQAPQQDEEHEDAFARSNGVHEHPGFEASMPDAEGGGYEPPSGGYEPPSYQPYQPEPEAEEEAGDAPSKPKKKSFMDDDDDGAAMATSAATLKKSQADRDTDDAFRKAAEADAARDQGKGGKGDQKAGWFGGWFKGKDPNLAPGPIRAKLGEENKFHFDKELGKWVSKDGGSESATPAAATPPPPRGPASRVASAAAAMGPPSGPPSRVSSSAGVMTMSGSRPPTAGSGRPPAASGPPSRVATPATNGGEGPGMPFAPSLMNGEASSGPPSRPPTSMSTASSLDDLIGPPGGKKGGTVKGKKKGGRYVDVMAK